MRESKLFGRDIQDGFHEGLPTNKAPFFKMTLTRSELSNETYTSTLHTLYVNQLICSLA